MGDGSDNYISQKTQPLNKASFGRESGYSDAFVRSETAPINPGKKRNTSALHASPEAVQQEIALGFEQLRTCQIIIDKFQQRIKILKWAIEHGDPKAATLGSKEKQIGEAISRTIQNDASVKRRVQIALFQYLDATKAVKEGLELLGLVQEDPDRNRARLVEFDLAKIQGKIYPLCNFHEVFKKDIEVALLFPPPSSPKEHQELQAAAAPPVKPVAPPPPAPPAKTTNRLVEKISHNPLVEKIGNSAIVDKIGHNPLVEKIGNSAIIDKIGHNPLVEKIGNPMEKLGDSMEKLGDSMEKLKGLKGLLKRNRDQ